MAPFDGGAGLLIDQYRHARHIAQHALDLIQLIAVMERGVGRKAVSDGVVLRDIVADNGQRLHALGFDLARHRIHRQRAVHRLSTGHRNRLIEQDLVGDVRLCRDRLANRQITRVIVGAVAQILE